MRTNRRHPRRSHHGPFGGQRVATVNGWQFASMPGPRPGPNVRLGSMQDLMAAFGRIDQELRWDRVKQMVVPMVPRVRPQPVPVEPLTMTVPPGMAVGFGLDIGPAFVTISQDMLDRWEVGRAELLAAALENLARQMNAISPEQVGRVEMDGLTVRTLQVPDAVPSVFVLLPELLGRILGPDPQLLLTPMRTVLLSLPPDEDCLAADLHYGIASEDPNCLPARAFLFRNGEIRIEELRAFD